MSGILAAIQKGSNALSAIQAAGQIFGGYGAVTLGPVKFQGLEVPEKIPLGGKQSLVVFTKPGGLRTIQAMGRDDDAMQWTGYLSGSNAESRMQTLDGLRQSGQVITLAFGQSSFQVIVASFVASYERANWIPYSISVVVLMDNANSNPTAPVGLGFLSNTLLSNAIASVTDTLSTVSAIVSQVTAIGENALNVVSNIAPVAALLGVNLTGFLTTASTYLAGAQGVADITADLASTPTAVSSILGSVQLAGGQLLSAFSAGQQALATVSSGVAPTGGLISGIDSFFTAQLGASAIAGIVPAASNLNNLGTALVSTQPGAGTILVNPSTLGGALKANEGTGFHNYEFVAPIGQAQ